MIDIKQKQIWRRMISRCYYFSKSKGNQAYIDCSVCDEWLTFSNFKRWMETQDWVGKELDKDILIVGNKIYSPNACVFVDAMTNSFVVDHKKSRANYLTGASWHSRDGKFTSRCRNSFTGKKESLGYFDNELEAHLAWKKRKHQLACQLAELQSDPRVCEALMKRYL